MERKIGEIFIFNGKKFKVVEGNCGKGDRRDGKNVHFEIVSCNNI